MSTLCPYRIIKGDDGLSVKVEWDVHYLTDEQIGIVRKYVAEIEAENEKLRTFLGGGSIVTDYWKDEDGTMHVLTTDGEHTYEYMRGGLADENAKLRELVADMWFWHYEGHIDSESQERQMKHIDGVLDRMRELGVEV